MATITSNTLSFTLDEVVSAVAMEAFYEESFLLPLLYDVRPSGRRRERTASLGGLSEFEIKNEGAAASEDSPVQQFEKDFVHVARGKTVNITREYVDDEEWGVVVDLGRQLGVMAHYTMEKDAMAPFREAFSSTSYLAEDGLTICNSAHLNVDSGNSQDNSGTTALSMASIKTTRTAMRNFTNYNGQLAGCRPDSLLVPCDLEEDAWEIIRSTGRPDSTNLAANMYNGMFQLYVSDFLSTGISDGDANNWFMLDTRKLKGAGNLLWFQRIPLEIYGDENKFTGTRSIGAYYRASHGLRDWRGIYGHNVA